MCRGIGVPIKVACECVFSLFVHSEYIFQIRGGKGNLSSVVDILLFTQQFLASLHDTKCTVARYLKFV